MAMRVSPFLNREEIFKDFTLDYDNVTNDILALDRGEWRPPRQFDDHKYVVKKLSTRMNQEDFNFLPPQVQQMYQQKLQMHEQLITKQMQDLQAAEAGFIPSGGYLVAADYYVTEPGGDPNKTKRVRVPSESMAWLLDKLQKQGQTMTDLTEQSPGVQDQLANMLPHGNVPARPGGAPGPAPAPVHGGPVGQVSPLGASHGSGIGPAARPVSIPRPNPVGNVWAGALH